MKINTQTQYQCVQNLEKRLSVIVDDVVAGANAYNGDGPYRALISDLMAQYKFDDAYIPLLVEMLNERTDDIVFEDMVDEIVAFRDPVEQILPGPAPLPYAPERMAHLLDKALDWIGMTGRDEELYDTLKNELGMTNSEISAAGFELERYYSEPDGDGFIEMK